ncbi:hypothetical protein GWI33_006925, partial [Rhynchophorus ferrugineus]
ALLVDADTEGADKPAESPAIASVTQVVIAVGMEGAIAGDSLDSATVTVCGLYYNVVDS